jgi:hydrogenase maturation protease
MQRNVLVLGYGNPGRLDDGLGPALVAALEARRIPGLTAEADYQLSVEDAESVARCDVVVFADADVSGPEPYGLRRIEPCAQPGFSTHSVDPETVLGLAHDLFGARAEGYVLGIRGYRFNGFGEEISEKARRNLSAALAFIEARVREGDFERYATAATAAGSAPRGAVAIDAN